METERKTVHKALIDGAEGNGWLTYSAAAASPLGERVRLGSESENKQEPGCYQNKRHKRSLRI